MDITGTYHKAIIAAVAAGIVAALGVLTGAMTTEDTFGDIPTVTWLVALGAFITGAGLTGGSTAISKANTRAEDVKAVARAVTDSDPSPETPYPHLEP